MSVVAVSTARPSHTLWGRPRSRLFLGGLLQAENKGRVSAAQGCRAQFQVGLHQQGGFSFEWALRALGFIQLHSSLRPELGSGVQHAHSVPHSPPLRHLCVFNLWPSLCGHGKSPARTLVLWGPLLPGLYPILGLSSSLPSRSAQASNEVLTRKNPRGAPVGSW